MALSTEGHIAISKQIMCMHTSYNYYVAHEATDHECTGAGCIPSAPTAPPVNPGGTALNSTTVALSWSPPPAMDHNGLIRHYIINITELETGRVFSLTSVKMEVTLHSLHPFYTYEYTITAVTVGPGPTSEVSSVQTPEDS